MGRKPDETTISAAVRKDTNKRLEVLAAMMQTSKSAIIRWAIEEYLAKKMAA